MFKEDKSACSKTHLFVLGKQSTHINMRSLQLGAAHSTPRDL